MSVPAEPAIKSYFFGKGYRDLWATIRECWSLNLGVARAHLKRAEALFPGDFGQKAGAIVLGTAGVAVVLFGTAFFTVASAVHIVVLASFFVLVYLAFTVVYLVERVALLIHGYFTVCPYCYHKIDLPEYFCSGCGAVHRRLIPSRYGILRRTCQCGTKLPTTFFLRRGALGSRCCRCGELLGTVHLESRKLFVPVLGGPAAGKSAFLYNAIQALIEVEAPRLGLKPSFVEKASEGDLARAKAALVVGRPPEKTADTEPRAFNLLLDGGASPRLIYLYDPAGEVLGSASDLVLHRYHEYLSGMLFIVDPFSISAVRAQYRDQLPAVEAELKPSRLPVTDALAHILITMEQHFGLSKTQRVERPLAVVLSKIDAFDLDDRLGERAVSEFMARHPEAIERPEARNKVIRDQLLRWGKADLVQQIEARFKRVAYFTCSALGRLPDSSGRPFEPRGVMEPLMWILGQQDRLFR